MTVEQTTQLIALILNSALMVLLSGLLWGAAWYRQQSLMTRLQETQRSQQLLFVNARPNRESQLHHLRQQRQRQRRQFRLAYISMVTLHYTLAMLMLSILLLGLRMLIFSNALISLAILLFVIGSAGLLIGVLLLLADVHQIPVQGQLLSDWAHDLVRQTIKRLRRPATAQSSIPRFEVPQFRVTPKTTQPTVGLPKTGTEG